MTQGSGTAPGALPAADAHPRLSAPWAHHMSRAAPTTGQRHTWQTARAQRHSAVAAPSGFGSLGHRARAPCVRTAGHPSPN